MPKLEKGQHGPLNVTPKSRERVYVGLGWDPNENITLLDKTREMIGGKKAYHDLDLACYIYDQEKSLLDIVSANPKNAIDQSGHIYHSGDNAEGFGDGDDEQISAELKDIPAHIHHLLFIATIKSGHVFSEVKTPEIRLVDGYSDHAFLHTHIENNHAGNQYNGFIFVNIFRHDNGWSVSNVSEFFDSTSLSHWGEYLKEHL